MRGLLLIAMVVASSACVQSSRLRGTHSRGRPAVRDIRNLTSDDLPFVIPAGEAFVLTGVGVVGPRSGSSIPCRGSIIVDGEPRLSFYVGVPKATQTIHPTVQRIPTGLVVSEGATLEVKAFQDERTGYVLFGYIEDT